MIRRSWSEFTKDITRFRLRSTQPSVADARPAIVQLVAGCDLAAGDRLVARLRGMGVGYDPNRSKGD
jgi:hypothetical protein